MTSLSVASGDRKISLPSSGSESNTEGAGRDSEGVAADLQNLWSTELLGIEPQSENRKDEDSSELKNFFENNIKRLENGHYMVKLPFKNNLRTLGDNENIARASLNRPLAKTRKNTILLKSLDDEMRNYVEKGDAEVAAAKRPGELAHYLPLLPVIRRNSSAEIVKVRVVKDAGARRKDEAALNDVLECGSYLLPDIPKVLLRFRREKIAIVSDIEKAFLQYKIHPDHRTFLSFFWPLGISKDSRAPIQEYWSTVLDFGIISSPLSTVRV
ncbi:uncharacterized protein LOC100901006 [Galendromus occidentalis]|uniref:Uncharacterized protein LOC100901006 n=1 Tax=Galendromus occidentalis TaxID=34638 RepID=A0AAJ6QN62_9ACAR|nr:uncharacterized protein LOC100901006 [Galendromus occidentalis]